MDNANANAFVHLECVSGNIIDAIVAFAFDGSAAFVGDAAPAARFGWVFDPFSGGEVVVVFLHCDDPVDVVERDGFESEV